MPLPQNGSTWHHCVTALLGEIYTIRLTSNTTLDLAFPLHVQGRTTGKINLTIRLQGLGVSLYDLTLNSLACPGSPVDTGCDV